MDETANREPLIKAAWLRASLFLVLLAALQPAAGYIEYHFINFLFMAFGGNYIERNIPDFLFETIFYFGRSAIVFLRFLLPVIIFIKLIDRRRLASIGYAFQGYMKDIITGLTIGFALILAGFFILLFSGFASVAAIQFSFTDIFFLAFYFTAVAFCEETAFRGYVFGSFAESMNKWAALALTSLIFGGAHFFNDSIGTIPVINVILGGFLLGIYYLYRKNLWFPIALHFAWNFFQGLVFGFAVSGNVYPSILNLKLNGGDTLTGGGFGLEGSLFGIFLLLAGIFYIYGKYSKGKKLSGEE